VIDAALILQGLIGAALVATVKMLWDTNKIMAVHSEKHSRHDARLEKLESKIC
jgi:hypothetical protein